MREAPWSRKRQIKMCSSWQRITREKKESFARTMELEKQINAKQGLELEIQRMRGSLSVMKHMENVQDSKFKQNIDDTQRALKQKEEELEDVEALNQALVIQECKPNDELQEARKELINVQICVEKLTKMAAASVPMVEDTNFEDDQLASMSTDDIARASRLLDNEIRVLKDEIEGLKTTLLPKMNAIQESQVLVASDISEIITSNAEITESVKQIASISTRVNSIQETVDENQWFNDERFARIEGGMQHMNESMKRLYNMIKNSHQPNAEQKKFFEGDDDDEDNDGKDEGGEGEGEGRSRKEDPKTDKVKSVKDSN